MAGGRQYEKYSGFLTISPFSLPEKLQRHLEAEGYRFQIDPAVVRQRVAERFAENYRSPLDIPCFGLGGPYKHCWGR